MLEFTFALATHASFGLLAAEPAPPPPPPPPPAGPIGGGEHEIEYDILAQASTMELPASVLETLSGLGILPGTVEPGADDVFRIESRSTVALVSLIQPAVMAARRAAVRATVHIPFEEVRDGDPAAAHVHLQLEGGSFAARSDAYGVVASATTRITASEVEPQAHSGSTGHHARNNMKQLALALHSFAEDASCSLYDADEAGSSFAMRFDAATEGGGTTRITLSTPCQKMVGAWISAGHRTESASISFADADGHVVWFVVENLQHLEPGRGQLRIEAKSADVRQE